LLTKVKDLGSVIRAGFGGSCGGTWFFVLLR
jgi:hypothetical protein